MSRTAGPFEAPRESILGWARLGCATSLFLAVPVWAVLTAVIVQINPDLWMAWTDAQPQRLAVLLRAGGMAAFIELSLIVVVGASLVVGGLSGWVTTRRSRGERDRMDKLVAEDAVLDATDWQVSQKRISEAPVEQPRRDEDAAAAIASSAEERFGTSAMVITGEGEADVHVKGDRLVTVGASLSGGAELFVDLPPGWFGDDEGTPQQHWPASLLLALAERELEPGSTIVLDTLYDPDSDLCAAIVLEDEDDWLRVVPLYREEADAKKHAGDEVFADILAKVGLVVTPNRVNHATGYDPAWTYGLPGHDMPESVAVRHAGADDAVEDQLREAEDWRGLLRVLRAKRVLGADPKKNAMAISKANLRLDRAAASRAWLDAAKAIED